jgi:L-rhamnose isomerase
MLTVDRSIKWYIGSRVTIKAMMRTMMMKTRKMRRKKSKAEESLRRELGPQQSNKISCHQPQWLLRTKNNSLPLS